MCLYKKVRKSVNPPFSIPCTLQCGVCSRHSRFAEALNEVVRTQDSAYNLLSTPFSNYGVRGDLAAKLVRYPGVEDYALALREHDRKAIYRAHMQLVDTRNMYAVVLDILRKNIAKISKPKSGNRKYNPSSLSTAHNTRPQCQTHSSFARRNGKLRLIEYSAVL